MRIDIRPRKRNAPRPAWKVAKAYHQWLRGRPCAMERQGDGWGRMEAAHTPDPGSKGIGTKVADRYAVPMCSAHHRAQHSKGWPRFLALMDASQSLMMVAAARLWNAWPGRIAWERKQEERRCG